MNKPHWLICREKGFFIDDLTGTCFVCGKTVQYRPHAAPLGCQTICYRCAMIQMASEPEGTHVMCVTQETVKELQAFSKAKEN